MFELILSLLSLCLEYHAEAFAVCENYSPPKGFNEKDLHRLLEKVGSPSGVDDLGKSRTSITYSHNYGHKIS